MAHLMKFSKTTIGHMGRHFERKQNDLGEYVKFSNQNINTENSHLNYNLAPHETNQVEFINKRCSEVKCLNRADVKVMCSWVVTKPKNIHDLEEELFFRITYQFLEKRYGKENVVSSYVHNDEITPHMHFAFVPVVFDKQKELYKVSAKEKVNRNDLRSFHGDLEKYLEKQFGREVGILNEATKEGNRAINDLKRGTAIKELEDISQKRQDASKKLQNMESNIEPLRLEKKRLESEIKGLEGKVLTLEQVKSIQIKKVLGTKVVRGMDYNDIMDLKQTALYVTNAINSNSSLEMREQELKKRENQLKEEFISKEKELEIKETTIKRRSLDEIMKISELQTKVNKYEEAFNKLPEEIQEQLFPIKKTSRQGNEYRNRIKNYELER